MARPREVGWVEHLGIVETPVAPGEVRCELPVDARHQNIQGVIHGSVVMALLDTAMGHALSGTLPPDGFCTTTQWSVQFLKATRPGDRLVATGRVLQKGNRIAYLEGICRNGAGEEVARAQGTWYVGTVRPPSAG